MSGMITCQNPSSPATAGEARKDSTGRPVARPHYRVRSGTERHEVEVDLPGIPRDEVDIRVEDDVLSVETRRSTPEVPAGRKALYRELREPDYRLRLQLNVAVDVEKVTARTRDGVLRIELPVAETARPRVIPVED